jgi:hypothetical protein
MFRASVGLLGLAASKHIELDWTDCSSASSHGKIQSITTSPDPLPLGFDNPGKITAVGTLDRDTASGSYEIKVKVLGQTIVDETADPCAPFSFDMKFLGVKVGHADIEALNCPVPAGDLTFKLGLQLTSVVPAGVGGATISLAAVDDNQEEMACLNIDAKIKSELAAAPEPISGSFNATDSLGFNLHFTAPSDSDSHPVILFVTGFSGLAPEFAYSSFVSKLANKGYIVVGMDHIKIPDYPSQGQDFKNIMDWVAAGNLLKQLQDAGIQATPDLDRVAVMGQSAGNHVVGQGLVYGCSIAKAQVHIDPVDGFDPFGLVTAQNLITPGQKLSYSIPTLLMDNELDPLKRGILTPPCAPANLGAPRWYDAAAGPIFNVNTSKYGHVDCLNDGIIVLAAAVCKTDFSTDKNAYRTHLANTIHTFLDGVFAGKEDNFAQLEDASSFDLDVAVRTDLKGLSHSDIKPGCKNTAVVV